MAMQLLRRVHREVEDVNEDFHSLRTVLKETDHKLKWNFIMFPNDGALSHLPLIGELVIPERYPSAPPVLDLFTKTLRWNVDVYQGYANDDTRSTMCFDILRPKAFGGTWEPEYTISCLFASLMQALVTPKVPQDYGADKPEFVTMDKLEELKKSVEKTYRERKDQVLPLPVIPTIPAVPISSKALTFTRPGKEEVLKSLDFINDDKYISQAIYLQGSGQSLSWSTVLDLRNLHPGVVFSAILSNKPGADLVGRKSDTILLRNGVTGTAAKKRANEPLVWFYHGKPLNDQNLFLSITITNDQFTMAYKDENSDKFLVHGDTPISKLGEAQIGDGKGIPFYLTLYLKRKSGAEGFIGMGYIHENLATPTVRHTSRPPKSVSLNLGSEQTARLQGLIDFYALGVDFKVQRSLMKPASATLIFVDDVPPEAYTNLIEHVYTPLHDKPIEVEVTAIAANRLCVVLILDNPLCSKDEEEGTRLSEDKPLFATMRLRDESVRTDYPAVFAARVIEEHAKDWVNVGDTYVQLPQPIKITCYLEFDS